VATRRATAATPVTESDDGKASALPSFEDSIRRLAEIVETLEGGELPLEESLRLFEEGVKLARTSQATLDHAERRVEELLSIDEDGNPVVREMDAG
jgi:exodeoxyribonuclease VII small subunit